MKRPCITPGPWEVEEGFIVALWEDGARYDICDPRCAPPAFNEEMDANAKAIAALPDLLAAMEGCLQSLKDCWELTDGQHGGARDIGTRNLIGEKIDWIKTALMKAGYTF